MTAVAVLLEKLSKLRILIVGDVCLDRWVPLLDPSFGGVPRDRDQSGCRRQHNDHRRRRWYDRQ